MIFFKKNNTIIFLTIIFLFSMLFYFVFTNSEISNKCYAQTEEIKLNLNLGESIAINCTVNMPEDATEVSMNFQWIGNLKYNRTYTMENKDNFINNEDGTITFIYKGITPQNMGKEITSTFSYKKNNKNFTIKKFFTVKEYCENLLTLSNEELGIDKETDENLKLLTRNLLNYGACAQIYMNTDSSNLVNNKVDQDENDFNVYSNFLKEEEEKKGGIDLISRGFRFGYNIQPIIRFTLKNNIEVSNITAKLQIDQEDFDLPNPTIIENKYQLLLKNFNYLNVNKPFTVKIFNDGVEIGEYIDSIGSIVNTQKNINTSFSNLFKSCFLYTESLCFYAKSVNNYTSAPSNLTVNLLSNPYGVEKDDLSFSWNMNDNNDNEIQTAYRVVIAKGIEKFNSKEYIFNSNWQNSSQNTAVKFEDLKDILEDNTLYYWAVQTKDKENEASDLSIPKAFTTAVGEEWVSKNGIWSSNSLGGVESDSKDWSDYVIECEFSIKEVALGIVFREQDKSNYYMWQYKVNDNQAFIVPHATTSTSSLAPVGNSIVISDNLKFICGDKISTKIICNGNTIKTFLKNNNNEYILVDTRDMSKYNLTEGKIGFRTGKSECGNVYSLFIWNQDENQEIKGTLYKSSFESNNNPFLDGTIINKSLFIDKGKTSGVFIDVSKIKYKDEKNQIVKCDDDFIFLRKEFEIKNYDLIDKIILSATAKSPEETKQYVYNLYINGNEVGVGPCRYGKTKEGSILYYNTYDITPYVINGLNCIASINFTIKEKMFLCQMTVYYKDGTQEILENSSRDIKQWKSLHGDQIFRKDNSIGTKYFTSYANNIDANLYPFGFDKVGFDDSNWMNCYLDESVINNMQLLFPLQEEIVKRQELSNNITVKKESNGNYIIDLGTEIVGGFELNITSNTSREINLYYGEELNEDGTVRYKMRTGNVYKEKWNLKVGQQCIKTIDLMTFRYIQIENCPIEITCDMVKGLPVTTEFDEKKTFFDSSDGLLNDIYGLMKNTIKQTTQDLYVDSQSRERGAYEGDLIINMLSSYAFENDYSTARFSLEYLYNHPTWPAEYQLLTICAAKIEYLYTGDINSLQKNYDILKTKTYLDHYNSTYKMLGGFNQTGNDRPLIDWPSSERDGYDTHVYYFTIINALAVKAYYALSDIGNLLGKTEDAIQYKEYADSIKESMIKKLYNVSSKSFYDGLSSSGTKSTHSAQHSNAYALYCGIYTDKKMANDIANTISVKSNNKIKMSVYGAFFLLNGLYQTGNGEIANKMLLDVDTEEGARTWAYMLYKLKATITTEAWNYINKSNMTYSHPWGSAATSAIVNGIFGINPITAGYNEFEIKFISGDVKNATLQTVSVQGNILVHFDKLNDNYFSAIVEIPSNTVSTVYLPGLQGKSVYINGVEKEADYNDGYYSIKVGSGLKTIGIK